MGAGSLTFLCDLSEHSRAPPQLLSDPVLCRSPIPIPPAVATTNFPC
jgi:hypothetical protein